MAEHWACPICGCSSKHYSPQYIRDVCDQCGRPVQDAAADQRRQSLDRTIAHAKDHLRVGNWDTCISLVEPLCSQAPADDRLYLILLAATTKGYTDYLLADSQSAAKSKAFTYWEKLYSLRVVNGVMQRYAAARRAELQRIRAKQWYRVAAILLGIGICLIVAGAASAFMCVLSLLGAAGLGWLLFSKCRVTRTTAGNSLSGNPFDP